MLNYTFENVNAQVGVNHHLSIITLNFNNQKKAYVKHAFTLPAAHRSSAWQRLNRAVAGQRPPAHAIDPLLCTRHIPTPPVAALSTFSAGVNAAAATIGSKRRGLEHL